MSEFVPFSLRLTGDMADYHQIEGYDGYMALAGFAWVLALAANYADTGKIRRRGEFEGRHAVRATALARGSVLADFSVALQNSPMDVFGLTGLGAGTPFLYGLVKRIISRNLGEATSDVAHIEDFFKRKSGDIEALVAISEAPIRQAHRVIGSGANEVTIAGGINIINKFDAQTKMYVDGSMEDNNVIEAAVSVSGFNANSGYGSVFDSSIGRVVPISMNGATLSEVSSVFGWGLNQYINRTGGLIKIRFTRILALDKRPKKYIVVAAEKIINSALDNEYDL